MDTDTSYYSMSNILNNEARQEAYQKTSCFQQGYYDCLKSLDITISKITLT